MTAAREPGQGREESPSLEEIETIAADWIARRDQEMSPADAEAFAAWTSADPRHAEAVAELEQAWAAINQPRLAGRGDAVMHTIFAGIASRNRKRRRTLTLFGALLASAAAIALAFVRLTPPPDSPAPRTITVRPDRVVLPDGSSIELNFGAEVTVKFTSEVRSVQLVRGEALFTVAREPARPFIVTAGGVSVRAVGTAFGVRYETDKVGVLVTQGSVAVERTDDGLNLIGIESEGSAALDSSSPREAPTLAAGHRLVVPFHDVPIPALSVPVTSEEMAGVLGWRQRRVEFTSTPLSEAVPLFNRANALQLALADASVAKFRISGVFWTDDPEGFARLLESSLGVRAVRGENSTIVLER